MTIPILIQMSITVPFFLNGTKIANLVRYLQKGITNEPSQKNEEDLFT